MVASLSDPAPSDEQLAACIAERTQSDRAWRRAQDACDQLYARHARRLLAFLSARVSRSDLEDMHQAVWQRVWQYLPEGFRGGNFRAWLYQIARNYVVDQQRKRRTEPLTGDSKLTAPTRSQPEELLVEQERMTILSQCLQQLGSEARRLVQARLAGESYHEICERMELPAERAHKLFHQAKEQLQNCVRRALA